MRAVQAWRYEVLLPSMPVLDTDLTYYQRNLKHQLPPGETSN